MAPLIIGIGHRKRVGKDAFGKALQVALQERALPRAYNIKLSKFVTPLKEITHRLYGWAGVQDAAFYEEHPDKRSEVLPALGMTPRELWVRFGTHAVRDVVYEDTWARYALDSVPVSAHAVIFTDLRFPNEVEAIKRLGGLTVRIRRPQVADTSDAADDALQDWDGWDYKILNAGSLQALLGAAQWLAPKLTPKMPSSKTTSL